MDRQPRLRASRLRTTRGGLTEAGRARLRPRRAEQAAGTPSHLLVVLGARHGTVAPNPLWAGDSRTRCDDRDTSHNDRALHRVALAQSGVERGLISARALSASAENLNECWHTPPTSTVHRSTPPRRVARFDMLVADAKLPTITLHGLRHSFATVALAAGIPTKIVSEVLGHSAT